MTLYWDVKCTISIILLQNISCRAALSVMLLKAAFQLGYETLKPKQEISSFVGDENVFVSLPTG